MGGESLRHRAPVLRKDLPSCHVPFARREGDCPEGWSDKLRPHPKKSPCLLPPFPPCFAPRARFPTATPCLIGIPFVCSRQGCAKPLPLPTPSRFSHTSRHPSMRGRRFGAHLRFVPGADQIHAFIFPREAHGGARRPRRAVLAGFPDLLPPSTPARRGRLAPPGALLSNQGEPKVEAEGRRGHKLEMRPVLHDPLALRPAPGFPMIGKKFSNGWKNWPEFSNDWKKCFQWLENFCRAHRRHGRPARGAGPFCRRRDACAPSLCAHGRRADGLSLFLGIPAGWEAQHLAERWKSTPSDAPSRGNAPPRQNSAPRPKRDSRTRQAKKQMP